MHVLFLPSWYPAVKTDIGGSFFREQALAVQAAGARVGIIAPSLRSLRKPVKALFGSGVVRREDDEGIATYRASCPHLTPRIWPLTLRRLRHLTRRLYDTYVAQEGQPDLLHVHAALPAGAGALEIWERYRIPFVLSEHSTVFARGLAGPAGLALARSVAGAAALRFAVSSPFARLLERELKVPVGRFSVMPNPVDDRFFERAISSSVKGRFRFLHISLLDEKKNVGSLIAAFADKFSGAPEVSLSIGGDGPERSSLRQYAVELGVADQVVFLGMLSREEVRDALANCDAFVLASRFETFGVVLVEAMAMGVPVIATRCGGPEDIVTDDTGLLVPVDDRAALAEAMEALKSGLSRWDRAAIREDCRRRFGADAISRRWLSIYDDVVRGDSGLQ